MYEQIKAKIISINTHVPWDSLHKDHTNEILISKMQFFTYAGALEFIEYISRELNLVEQLDTNQALVVKRDDPNENGASLFNVHLKLKEIEDTLGKNPADNRNRLFHLSQEQTDEFLEQIPQIVKKWRWHPFKTKYSRKNGFRGKYKRDVPFSLLKDQKDRHIFWVLAHEKDVSPVSGSSAKYKKKQKIKFHKNELLVEDEIRGELITKNGFRVFPGDVKGFRQQDLIILNKLNRTRDKKLHVRFGSRYKKFHYDMEHLGDFDICNFFDLSFKKLKLTRVITIMGSTCVDEIAFRLLNLIETAFNELHSLHKIGYLHRGIKPDNIVLDCSYMHNRLWEGDFSAHLIDFEKAVQYDPTDKTYRCRYNANNIGVGDYTAPEASSYPTLVFSTKSDIFSLGKSLSLLLSVEFHADNLKSLPTSDDAWFTPFLADVKNLLTSMINDKASLRPSIPELLESLNQIKNKYGIGPTEVSKLSQNVAAMYHDKP